MSRVEKVRKRKAAEETGRAVGTVFLNSEELESSPHGVIQGEPSSGGKAGGLSVSRFSPGCLRVSVCFEI